MNVDILGWIGNIGFIVGSFLIARRDIKGFYFFGLGNLLYLFVGLFTGIYSLVLISIYLLTMNIYGIINWYGGIKKLLNKRFVSYLEEVLDEDGFSRYFCGKCKSRIQGEENIKKKVCPICGIKWVKVELI